MNSNHIRYREIPVRICLSGCPHQEGETLKIILFKRDHLLRSHTVKHFASTAETSWRGIVSFDSRLINQCISELHNIGCRFLKPGWHEDPPCSNCSLFDRCSELTHEIEEVYLNIVEKILEEGGEIPRYACFFSDKFNTDIFYAVPNRKVVVKAALHGDTYNLMTCYNLWSGLSVEEICQLQKEKILSEAFTRKNVIWCDQESWNLHEDNRPGKKGKRAKTSGKKKKRSRRSRGGGRSFREYFENYDG
ncbi:MAG: hypothetical protein DRI57_30090 [Deltaproteobacteria bacterium]|nr:MAG: hypothetical protein DRI57_30090 [Deltaproteobacteria bacterium]